MRHPIAREFFAQNDCAALLIQSNHLQRVLIVPIVEAAARSVLQGMAIRSSYSETPN